MKTKFRFPGAEYAFAELETTEGSVFDNARELRDVDDSFLGLVGNVLARGCALTATGPLGPTVVEDSVPGADYAQYHNPTEAAYYASQPPQEAQGYSPAPQAYNAPQNGYQSPQQGYQNQAPTPPGQQAPICQMHSRPAEFKPAGTSRKTGRPYDAFWACSAGDNNCTRASKFPRP